MERVVKQPEMKKHSGSEDFAAYLTLKERVLRCGECFFPMSLHARRSMTSQMLRAVAKDSTTSSKTSLLPPPAAVWRNPWLLVRSLLPLPTSIWFVLHVHEQFDLADLCVSVRVFVAAQRVQASGPTQISH